jgi:hypothetical protein
MNHLNSRLAREIGRQVRWREKFWGRRYQAILVSEEESVQVERLLYILRHGCKENLVRRPSDWPGATSTDALLTGRSVRGTWFDRTAEYRLSRRRNTLDRDEIAKIETLQLKPLPCWQHLSADRYRARCAELVAVVEAETERRLQASGREPLGRQRIALQNPHLQSNRPKKGPAPLVHAATPAVRRAMRQRYRAFVDAFRRAATQLRLGVVGQPEARDLFPPFAFPPPGKFIERADPVLP